MQRARAGWKEGPASFSATVANGANTPRSPHHPGRPLGGRRPRGDAPCCALSHERVARSLRSVCAGGLGLCARDPLLRPRVVAAISGPRAHLIRILCVASGSCLEQKQSSKAQHSLEGRGNRTHHTVRIRIKVSKVEFKSRRLSRAKCASLLQAFLRQARMPAGLSAKLLTHSGPLVSAWFLLSRA